MNEVKKKKNLILAPKADKEPIEITDAGSYSKARQRLDLYIGEIQKSANPTERLLKNKEKQENYIREFENGIPPFDYEIIISNVNYFCKIKELRVSDLEAFIGVSRGYLSRTFKEDSGKRMSIDNLYRMASIFGVSIQQLIFYDYAKPSENLEYAKSFIEDLIEDTTEYDLSWNPIDFSDNYFSQHELLYKRLELENKDSTAFLKSMFLEDKEVEIVGETYCSNIMANKWCYIFKLKEADLCFYELYILEQEANVYTEITTTRMNPILSTLHEAIRPINDRVEFLYSSIEKSNNDIKIPAHTLNVLKAYAEYIVQKSIDNI